MNEDIIENLILIVEDDPTCYFLIKEYLNETKVKTLHAENGVQAVDIIKDNKSVNLVLMDVKLPKLNGFDATKEIKKIRNNIPIIFQTANGLSDQLRKNVTEYKTDYLLKPYSKSDLCSKINDYICLS